jgi:hypothetical protein
MAALVLGLIRTTLRPDLLFVDQWHPWATVRVAQYGLSNRMQSYVQVYRYDRVRLRHGLLRSLTAVWRYRRERRAAAERWRAAHPELSSWARWERASWAWRRPSGQTSPGPRGGARARRIASAPDRERAA